MRTSSIRSEDEIKTTRAISTSLETSSALYETKSWNGSESSLAKMPLLAANARNTSLISDAIDNDSIPTTPFSIESIYKQLLALSDMRNTSQFSASSKSTTAGASETSTEYSS
ncbi:hypothetical protein SK128_024242 [Halocaridina rubra]|uniref:Uncharacterized protein n=1 Tax=Halocaridina rubra TaxID=373956 RepID=A0AAN8WNV7_HALRR